MSAKITLVGPPQGLRIEDETVTFKIVTGPASNTAPKGLPLFKAVTYAVQCSARQYRRARTDERDRSELVIEGYQEPRVDEQGRPYVAVVATNVSSKQAQAQRKLEQLREDVVKAEEAYEAASAQSGDGSPQARAALDAFEKLKAGLVRFMESHPEVR